MSTLCLFEDHAVDDCYPLTDTRHVATLLAGTRSFVDRARHRLHPDKIVMWSTRTHIPGTTSTISAISDSPDDDIVCLNGLALLDDRLSRRLKRSGRWAIHARGRLVAVRASAQVAIDSMCRAGTTIPGLQTDVDENVTLYRNLWELIAANGGLIALDAESLKPVRWGANDESARLLHPERIHLGDGARLGAGVVLDATQGPIVIAENANIMHGAVIIGPVYIGPGSVIKVAARIYPGTSIGRSCKIGGEVEDSIVIACSNKQHDGFLGHSYLGSWVNLGADTNTSDLKNNYGSIRIRLDGREIETGTTFLGSLVGDHAKTSINTMLNSGTTIGVFANVFGAGFPPKEVPRFAWGMDGTRYDIEKAVALAKVVMARRNEVLSPEDETLLRYLHSLGSNFSSAHPADQ